MTAIGLALSFIQPAQGKAVNGQLIKAAPPEGFADLTQDRTILTDIYFGGTRRGEAMVSVRNGKVVFLDPGAVLKLIPHLADPKVVAAALQRGGLAANAALACAPGADQSRCGQLKPETVGLILDQDRFRLDLFLNPQLLSVQDHIEEQYLPPPPDEYSLINAIGGVLAGRSLGGREDFSVQDQLVLAKGEQRIRADVSYASEIGLGADRLVFEWDRPELRYSAGALWAPGNDLSGRRRLLGVGVESQIDTRLDKDEIQGSPIIVFLNHRARVDVLQGGRVVNSAIYDAGNQQIDTANLPEGSYGIVLRIAEAGQPTREESRFYTKSRRIPARGRTDFFGYGGLLVDSSNYRSLAPSSRPFAQMGVVKRLSESWAFEGSVQTSDQAASAEVGPTFLTPFAQIRAALVADTRGSYGTIFQLSSGGGARLNFNLDVRHIEQDTAPANAIIQSQASSPINVLTAANAFRLSEPYQANGGYSQAGGIVSYSLSDFRFLGTFFYRRDDRASARYSIGPSMEYDVFRKGPLKVTLRADLTTTEQGSSGFAGVSVRLLGGSGTFVASAGGRSSTQSNDTPGSGLVSAVSGSWSPDVGAGQLSIGAGYEHDPEQNNMVLTSQFQNKIGSLSADFSRSEQGGTSDEQHSLGFQTSFAAGAGAAHLTGRGANQSVVVLSAPGARKQDSFNVLVNEQVAGSIVGGHTLALALPTYRAYRIRIRPSGKGLVAYDSGAREVGLYPGVVTKLEWHVSPVQIMFGRLLDPAGEPIRVASLMGKNIWAETDDQGYFQIEAPQNAELRVTLANGQIYPLTLPAAKNGPQLARLGAIVCCQSILKPSGPLFADAHISERDTQ